VLSRHFCFTLLHHFSFLRPGKILSERSGAGHQEKHRRGRQGKTGRLGACNPWKPQRSPERKTGKVSEITGEEHRESLGG